jgi:exodeoxyribonuclease VII small subunit
MNFQEAINELKEISSRLDREEFELDQLEQLLERAEQLSKVCKTALRRVSDKLSDFQQSQFVE